MLSGRKIKEIMQDKGLKVNYVANKAGISVTYLSMIINDRRTPSLDTLQAIAEVLEVDMKEFFLASHVSVTLNQDGEPTCTCS